MEILKPWCPPSREHWELLLRLWQFFPLVCQCLLDLRKLPNSSRTVHNFRMVLLVLPNGQNIHRFSFQYSWEDRLGYYGGPWIHYAIVHNVFAPKTRRY